MKPLMWKCFILAKLDCQTCLLERALPNEKFVINTRGIVKMRFKIMSRNQNLWDKLICYLNIPRYKWVKRCQKCFWNCQHSLLSNMIERIVEIDDLERFLGWNRQVTSYHVTTLIAQIMSSYTSFESTIQSDLNTVDCFEKRCCKRKIWMILWCAWFYISHQNWQALPQKVLEMIQKQ